MNPKPICSGMFLNLDRCNPHEIPNFKPTEWGGDKPVAGLMWMFGDVTMFLRVDQVGELIAKLAVHLPPEPAVRPVLREMLERKHAVVLDSDLDLPVRRDPEVVS